MTDESAAMHVYVARGFEPREARPLPFPGAFHRPTLTSYGPPGFPLRDGVLGWVCHHAHVFDGSEYAVFALRDGQTLVSYIVPTPRFFRFPFMGPDDIMVNNCWTAPAYRNRGLNSLMFERVMSALARPGRAFWLITEDTNAPMIRVAEKLGFAREDRIVRRRRFGTRILGSFELVPEPRRTTESR